jgi:hypothetical protein
MIVVSNFSKLKIKVGLDFSNLDRPGINGMHSALLPIEQENYSPVSTCPRQAQPLELILLGLPGSNTSEHTLDLAGCKSLKA